MSEADLPLDVGSTGSEEKVSLARCQIREMRKLWKKLRVRATVLEAKRESLTRIIQGEQCSWGEVRVAGEGCSIPST